MRPISDIERRQQKIVEGPKRTKRRRGLSQFVGASDYVVIYQIRPGVRFWHFCTAVLFKDCEELTDAEILALEGGCPC
jgi:hypothetical protein